jgi:hypothetical protein
MRMTLFRVRWRVARSQARVDPRGVVLQRAAHPPGSEGEVTTLADWGRPIHGSTKEFM